MVLVQNHVHLVLVRKVPVQLRLISALSKIRISIPPDLRPAEARESILLAVQKLGKRFPQGFPKLNPVKVQKNLRSCASHRSFMACGRDFRAALKMFGSNIIFSNGLLDPWSGGSVLEDISERIVALVTEKGAHHIDLRAATVEDPDWLVEQRATEIKLIQGWIELYKERRKGFHDRED